jgi:hypothetical protein
MANFYTQNSHSSVEEPRLGPQANLFDTNRQTFRQAGDALIQTDSSVREQGSMELPGIPGQSVNPTAGTSGQAMAENQTTLTGQSAAALSYEYLR